MGLLRIWNGGFEPKSEPAGGAYMPQLDGLRAIAVTLVILAHCWWRESGLGHQGVRLFFVLSGFLITGILLELRRSVEAQQTTLAFAWRAFFVRRALRIFPAYFALLLIYLALGVPGFHEQLVWHALFLSNISIFLEGSWEPWQIAHLWSLSVEEQFYLLWPALIFLAPRRSLTPLCLALAAVAVIWRIVGVQLSDMEYAAGLTPASFDALAGGAIVALAFQDGWRAPLQRFCLWCAAPWAALTATLALKLWEPAPLVYWSLVETLGAVALAGVVSAAASGETGRIASRFLTWRPIRGLGRISYGLYLFHGLMLWVAVEAIERTNVIAFRYGPELFILCYALTLVFATISWRWFELPFLRLKRRAPYQPVKA